MKTTGIGTRVLNFLIDTLLVFLLSMLFFRIWNWNVFYWGFTPLNFGWFFFGTLFLYYFIAEGFFSKSLGKRISYSRVVSKTGSKAGWGRIFIRSLVRLTIIDMFFIPFLDKTLHDYLSGTELVQD
ncbi:MAG: RDD family protein [Chitinophagaceae bacterium]|nr:RDD family protein [Chitinophagaceae bacterium]